ncbi:MAG: penicillin-binding protein 2 [Anaerolineae bacterium]|nr:penicillin-binding protein 2 [Anaerolineae bacterium]
MVSTSLKRLQSTSLLRITIFQAVVVLVFGGFGVRLWRLQVVAGQEYSELAKRNRTRLISTNAPRGVMYDRTHELLVRNVPEFQVLLIPAYLPKDDDAQEEILQRLHELLDLPLISNLAPAPYPPFQGSVDWGLRDIVEQGSLYAPYEPIVLKKGVSREVAFLIEEAHLDLPGVLVEVDSFREYLTGALTAHLLGYMGPIPAGLEDQYGQEQGYGVKDWIGLSGLESEYEDELRGRKGQKTIEVDVAGREVRTVGQPTPPQPGQSLALTLDLDLQRYLETVLAQAMDKVGSKSAVAIVAKVDTGEILSMVSLPTFDNNLFAQGISGKDFNRLNTHPAHPLLNKAISGVYEPGSVFKLVPASAALEEGIVGRWTLLTCPSDSGVLYLPNRYYPDNPELARPFYCWTHVAGFGHGRLDIVSAIAYSCDIYFYLVSGGFPDQFEGLGLERLRTYAEAFGFGHPTGIDLASEASGRVPTIQWKRINYGANWTTGDTYNMGIGQGFLGITPLQMMNATAAVANGGTLYQPQLVYQIIDVDGNIVRDFEPRVIRQLPVSDENLQLVREGMRAVVTRGTAQFFLYDSDLKAAAKTGTAEYCDSPDCMDENGVILTAHAWFTAFAPYEDPEIVVTVFVYGGGEGAVTAMPVAEQVLKYYFQLD